MSIEGRLTIDLDRAADGTGHAVIASSRPLRIARVFVGKSPEEVVRTLPLLFNVCGLAQGTAAAQACERALGIDADPGVSAVRRLLVCTETLREHLVRAVMDWPRFLGNEPQTADMLRVMRLSAGIKSALDAADTALTIGGSGKLDGARLAVAIADVVRLVEELVIGEPIDTWRARQCADDLDWAYAAKTPSQQLVRAVVDRGWASAGHADTSFLPDLTDDDLAERLLGEDNEEFVAAPTW
jgi:hypothetical protein